MCQPSACYPTWNPVDACLSRIIVAKNCMLICPLGLYHKKTNISKIYFILCIELIAIMWCRRAGKSNQNSDRTSPQYRKLWIHFCRAINATLLPYKHFQHFLQVPGTLNILTSGLSSMGQSSNIDDLLLIMPLTIRLKNLDWTNIFPVLTPSLSCIIYMNGSEWLTNWK